MRSCRRGGGVAGEDGHGLLGEDRAGVDLGDRDVHGAAGDLDAVRQGIVDGVPAGKARQQRRVGVEDPVTEVVVERAVEDGAEAGHGDQVDVVVDEQRCSAPSV